MPQTQRIFASGKGKKGKEKEGEGIEERNEEAEEKLGWRFQGQDHQGLQKGEIPPVFTLGLAEGGVPR